jgi:hypothetical protein
MSLENNPSQKEGIEWWEYPDAKIFTHPDVKMRLYPNISSRLISVTIENEFKPISDIEFSKKIYWVYIFEFFWTLVSAKPDSLWLPAWIFLPKQWMTAWRDIPFRKTPWKISIESIVLWETPLFDINSLQKLKKYWEVVNLVSLSVEKQIWSFANIQSMRIIQDDLQKMDNRKIVSSWWRAIERKDNNGILAFPEIKLEGVSDGKMMTSLLRVEFKDGSMKVIDLAESYRIITSPKTKSQRDMVYKLENDRKILRESMNRETFFDGSISFEYVLWTGVGVLGWVIWTQKIVKSIRVKSEWRTVEIVPSEILQGNDTRIKGIIGKEIESQGFAYDPHKKTWINVWELAKASFLKKLPKLTPSEIYARTGYPVPPHELVEFQKNAPKILSEKTPKSLLKNLIWKGVASLLVPMDILLASEFSTHSNIVTWLSAATDMATFLAGYKVADSIGHMPWVVGKVGKLSKIPLGMAGTVYADQVWKTYLQWSKKTWQYNFSNDIWSQYTDGQSIVGNMVWGGFITSGLDYVQRNKWTGEHIYDIGIPKLRFPLFGKKFLNLPEVTIFQGRINLATDPWEWFRGQPWRTVDQWNDQVINHLPYQIMKSVEVLYGKMIHWQYPFTKEEMIEKKVTTKDQMFTLVLNETLSWWDTPSGWFGDVKANIISLVQRELINSSKMRASLNMDSIARWIYAQVPKMEIDKYFVQYYYPLQIEFHQSRISSYLFQIQRSIAPKEFAYLLTIQSRMEKNQPLCDPGKKVQWDFWKTSYKWIRSETNLLYQWLLDNKKHIQIDFDQDGRTPPQDMEIGEAVAYILDEMLSQKRRKEFYNEIQNGNKKGVKWTI